MATDAGDAQMDINELKAGGFLGEVYDEEAYRLMFATDASIYRELPSAVVFPSSSKDLCILVEFAKRQGVPLIPRGAGTSLAGQCVGNGVVVDVSRHMNQILKLDLEKGIAVVEPGVVRDELNRCLVGTKWFFGPNTSTSNRATVGGMVGNNSSGTSSVRYGVTRDKVMSMEVILSDAMIHEIRPLEFDGVLMKTSGAQIPKPIVQLIEEISKDKTLHKEVEARYPDASIHRRNTGYALDRLLDYMSNGFVDLSQIFCGSEGTLGLISAITVKLDLRPPEYASAVISHFDTIDSALRAVPVILGCKGIYALEMMDDKIIECASRSTAQKENLFFIKGKPEALLMTEVRGNSQEEYEKNLDGIIHNSEGLNGLSHNEIVPASQMSRIWSLRAAGLGVLSNIPGDDQALACIEDTAVRSEDLADYIKAFTSIMKRYEQEAVYYAHAGAGELHLRPVLNLKTEKGKADFIGICRESAELVRKYRGSLSGEHGDGRVRAPFIKEFYGDYIYNYLLKVKKAFDPDNIFNPGKIVEPKDLLDDLRVDWDPSGKELYKSAYSYEPDESIMQHAARCNGSGDCRKSHELSPGMCPTYQATGNEIHTTRARANLIREALGREPVVNPLSESFLDESMKSCLACKACKSECPSGVDVALLKSEYLSQSRKQNGGSVRDFLLAHPQILYKMTKYIPFAGKLINSKATTYLTSLLGFTDQRLLPVPVRRSVDLILKKHKVPADRKRKGKVVLAIDEFINYFDVSTGLACYKLLESIGYEIHVIPYVSGRAYISKGYLEKASELAAYNIKKFSALEEGVPIVGIEPSAITSFRDEYRKFKSLHNNKELQRLNRRLFLVEEFLLGEIESGALDLNRFSFRNPVRMLQHVHCHQRALSNTETVPLILNSIPGWMCTQIDTGCCGMAGGFGYEKDQFDMSMKVANLGLFPAIESHPEHYIIASGMSCRHQIRDGLRRKAYHPAHFLVKMLESGSEPA